MNASQHKEPSLSELPYDLLSITYITPFTALLCNYGYICLIHLLKLQASGEQD